MSRGRTAQLVWVGALTLLYAAFWIWYGGNGRPLTPDEGREMLERIRARMGASGSAELHPEFRPHVEKLIDRDDGREFYMVNIETVREGPEAEAAEAAYARAVVPMLLARGSHPVFASTVSGPLLGELGGQVQRVAVVRYRSLRDFLDMNADPAMVDAVPHKWASLSDTQVFPVAPFLSLASVRLTAGLIAALLALGGALLLRRLDGEAAR